MTAQRSGEEIAKDLWWSIKAAFWTGVAVVAAACVAVLFWH